MSKTYPNLSENEIIRLMGEMKNKSIYNSIDQLKVSNPGLGEKGTALILGIC